MERLQKVIAHAGVASRRKAEQLIVDGKVTVNGQLVKELGTKVTASDKIEVEGIPIDGEEKVYLLFYKPRGVISAVSDDKGRKVVTDYINMVKERVYPIGRLDYNTSGLLLLTNDGEFAQLMMHPSYQIDKTYVAKVKGIPSKETLVKLAKGIKLEDGMTAPARVKTLKIDKKAQTAIIELTIREGRNHQVRRMFAAIGCNVEKLSRERFAHLNLNRLNAGNVRELTPHEVKQLRALAEKGKS